jgi:hypothetical protein
MILRNINKFNDFFIYLFKTLNLAIAVPSVNARDPAGGPSGPSGSRASVARPARICFIATTGWPSSFLRMQTELD